MFSWLNTKLLFNREGKTNNTPCPHISQTLSCRIQLSRSCSHHRHPQTLNHIFLSVPSPICFILQQPQSSHSPCLAQLLQRWQHPHLPTPALISSCSLDKAITPLHKQFMIIQKGATAFETNTFQITVDGLWFLIKSFFFNLWDEVKTEKFSSLFEDSVCLWWLRCCDIKVDKRDYTRNTHAYSVQLLGSPEGIRLKPISPHWHSGRLIYISRSVLEVTKSSHFPSYKEEKKMSFHCQHFKVPGKTVSNP